LEKKNKVAVVILVLLVSSVAIASLFFTSSDGLKLTTVGNPSYDYLKGATVIPYETRKVNYNEATGDYRPEYPISDEQYGLFFGNLPPFPQDFYDITTLVYDGRVTDYTRLSENYWKQPEFFSGWFSSFNSSYLNHDPAMWLPSGYSMFPLIKEVKAPSGETVTVSAFMRTGFGTESYQGIIFRPSLPHTAKALTGEVIFEQPPNADKYLKLSIITPNNPIFESFKNNIQTNNVQEEDWFVVLKPTLQKIDGKLIGFQNDWIRQFDVEIEISSNTPKGMYVIAIESHTPCFHINQEFYLSHEHEYYGKYYFPGGRIQKSETPHFQIILEVT